MNKRDLELEIRNASIRIEDRKSKIESEINELNEKINTFTKRAWKFVWGGVIISILAVIFYLCKNTEKGFGLNLLGDFMAGTVASIWSLAGLFFIYVAFLGQKQQLLSQQLEIMYSQLEVKYTRLELAGQREEMAQQNSTLRQQKFENTFFQLLSNHNSIVNSIDLLRNGKNGREVVAQGRDCFVTFYNRLNKAINNDNITLKEMNEKYDVFFRANVADLGHYFGNLYHIIKFIDESDMDNKKRYTNFIRAQLSAGELILLFYNCLSDYGKGKFKPLIEKYSLIKNLNTELVINSSHVTEYAKKAFK